MLVLARKEQERIVLNNDITIMVVRIRGKNVQLGIEAPKDVVIKRGEVYDSDQRDDK